MDTKEERKKTNGGIYHIKILFCFLSITKVRTKRTKEKEHDITLLLDKRDSGIKVDGFVICDKKKKERKEMKQKQNSIH